MTNLHFAQISDIHISSLGDHDDILSGRSADFLVNVCAKLNSIEDLDFVLITGDLFDQANQQEFDQFQAAIATLQRPYYIIPGNHDRRALESREGLTRYEFARHFNPQIAARPVVMEAQVGYWSMTIKPDVQLIGLDSIRDEDWGGIIDMTQIEWLKSELTAHRNKLIIVAVHHPLHELAPIDDDPYWRNFVCDNGSDVLALLDNHPQVKVVLTGHHHLTKVDKLGERLHLACPALALYPCAYRTLRLTHHSNHTWQIEWLTHPVTDGSTIAEARQYMFASWTAVGFEADFVEEHIHQALGNGEDRDGKAVLGNLSYLQKR